MVFRGQRAALAIACALLCGCGVIEKEPQPSDPDLQTLISKPLPPEKTEQLLDEVGDNWLYGEGMGGTILTVGAVVAFPPYALLVAGNAGLSLAGYKQVWLSDALPDQGKQAWQSAYQGVAEAPGRVSAAVAGEEFRSEEVARKRINEILESSTKRNS